MPVRLIEIFASFALTRLALTAKAGVGYFEDWVRDSYAGLEKLRPTPWGRDTLDLRIVKARGDRGYGKVRISVRSHAPLTDLEVHGSASGKPVLLSPSEPFRYKWKASYDLGTSGQSCSTGTYATKAVQWDADCLLACSDDENCAYYTWYPKTRTCEFADMSCALQQDATADGTFLKYGTNYFSTATVDLTPGLNNLSVAGENVTITLPAAGAGVRGVVISDPCFSGRWVDCRYGKDWDTFNRTVLMLNALAARGDIDFFAILGDNFYDQDGRLTNAVWRQLSPAFKQSFLLSTPGNHDVWVAGGPGSTADEYDQYGYGFMQFYAQDSMAAVGEAVFNFSAAPAQPDPNRANNLPDNFILYHQLGNVGIIAYSGGGFSLDELTPGLRAACAFMGRAKPAHVLLLGHWDGASSGCPSGSDTPHVRDFVASLPGCSDFGDELRFADGHTHCNHLQGQNGFMIGGHGMDGCGQYGFLLLDSTGPGLRASYFEERNETTDRFDEIYRCVEGRGASGCTALAETWLNASSVAPAISLV